MGKAVYFTSYEEVPYRSLPSPYSHPASMAMVATLLGLEPPPVTSCRVLELGSGTGPNLLPMAADLPDGEFVGIDLSPRQVAMSKEAAAALGLRNVHFLEMNILAVGESLGRFDYIIAHGIYSWVPRPVRDRLLGICRELLTERGLAYVSYNVYPGWHLTNVLRDLMLYHVQGLESAAERAEQALAALSFLTDGVTQRSDAPAQFMQSYARTYLKLMEKLGPHRDSSLHHDILAEVNDPIYFHEFAQHAEAHGLEYVAEAAFQLSMPPDLPPPVRERLSACVGSVAEMEQYMDFLTMRTFRQSMLCHSGREIARSLAPERLRSLYVRAPLQPAASRPELSSVTVERFNGPGGLNISTNHPLSKAALQLLGELFPRSLAVPELVRAARERLGQPSRQGDGELLSADSQELARMLLRTFAQRRELVTLRAHAPPLTEVVSERPTARALARWQAQQQPTVTNGYHEATELEPLQRCLLPLLDGTRDRLALLSQLCALAEAGSLRVERNGRSVTEPDQVRILLGRDLDATLESLARLGLLVA